MSGRGLDSLTSAKHFHLENNSFSGSIPASIFNTEMKLIHLLLNNNSFTGAIPTTVGNLLHLQIMQFDFNALNGSVPSGISTIPNLTTLQLNNNQLSGQLPDLSNCTNLQMLYLGNNSFTAAPIPTWIKSLTKLYLLSIDSANLIGNISADFFSSSPFLSHVTLAANRLNGTLDLSLANTNLQYVNVTNNQLDGFINSSHALNHTLEIILDGNPFCTNNPSECISLKSANISPPTGSTGAADCSNSCQSYYVINPANCRCVRPLVATLEISATMFPFLNVSLMEEQFTAGLNNSSRSTLNISILESQVVLKGINAERATVSIFPPNTTDTWPLNNASLISYAFKSLQMNYPGIPGQTPAMVWDFLDRPGPVGNGLSAGAKAGIAIAVVVFVVTISVIGVYAIKQRRRAIKAEEANKPFAAWIVVGEGRGAHIPQLKGARWFSLDEIRKCTNNFSLNNEIGEGGYGKVYKGYLASGKMVAIKRARIDSLQGAAEFKNEIELLSRVHHKNLVSLIGFCFEEGEQMLVYEFMPNGTLRECLSGKTGIQMDWERRISLALCSARGIAYLHTEADPPIIHRDVKSCNILLDDKLVAKVADFGISTLASTDDAMPPSSTQVKGTPGYLDPDYFMTNRLTDKSDVYSFGVVLLELVTGRLPIQGGKYVVREMKMAVAQGGMSQVEKSTVDPALKDYPPQALEKLVELALACVQDSPDDRPTMFEVVKEIESLSEVPLAKLGVSPGGKYAETQDDKLSYMQQSFGSTAFEYSGSYSGINRTLEPK